MRVIMENGKEIKMFGGKFWGVEVSPYGMKHKRLDYKTMVTGLTYNEFFDCGNILNVINDWECITDNDYNEETGDYYEIMNYFIVSERAAENLKKYTDEIVFYSPSADLYLFGVVHCGTSWDYVLTSYEIMEE